MCEPASYEYSFDETIGQIESQLKMALEHAKEMDKNESVWHPNAIPGVNVSLSNETMRLIGNAMRDLERLEELVAERNEQPKGGGDSPIINMEYADIDHILKIGRDFQNTDTWHGAHYDTVKLLCDTIEHLRKHGTRNCDVEETYGDASCKYLKTHPEVNQNISSWGWENWYDFALWLFKRQEKK